MIKRTEYLILIVAWAAVLSCSKTQEGPAAQPAVQGWSGSSASIEVGASTKTVLQSYTPLWTAEDAITVFDEDGTPVQFTNTSGAGAVATFTTASWTGKSPSCAAFSYGTPSCSVAGGTVTVSIPSVQVVQDNDSFARDASPSVGIVTSSSGVYSISGMQNVAALLEFTVTDGSSVSALTIEGGNGEQIAGGVTVSTADMSWTAASGPATSITLQPSSGAFAHGVKYYAAILPGTYPKGIRISFADAFGETVVKEMGKELGLTLMRNRVCAFDNIDYIPVVPAPDEFVLHVNFRSGWPFMQSAVAAGDETASGEEYTYNYSSTLKPVFRIVKPDGGSYSYNEGALSFSAAGGRIVLPQVADRYLNSVVLVHTSPSAVNTANRKRIEIHKVSDDSQIGSRYVTHQFKYPTPVAKFSPHSAEKCYISLLDATDVTDIYLLYNSTAAGSDAVKLGFESQYRNYNNNNGNNGSEGDGSQYVYQGSDGNPTTEENGTALSPFVGIVARATPGQTWTDSTVPNPYTFTQTCNGVAYSFESVRPGDYANQRMWNWQNGLWSMDQGSPNILKVPRTGKLVWVGVACGNVYAANKDRRIGVLAKDAGDADYSEVGNYTFLASAAQGTGDGSTLENSAIYKAWCLDDDYSPTKDYFISVRAGSTCLTYMVLVYL